MRDMLSDKDNEDFKYDSQFVNLRVKPFAILREIIGTQELILQLPNRNGGTTVADLKSKILELYPKISVQRIPIGIAINCKVVTNDKLVINYFDEIALLPPISGG